MNAKVEVDAGVCGFKAVARVASEDNQNVTFGVVSDCGKIRAVAELLKRKGPVDAFQELGPNAQSVVLSTGSGVLKGCCAACVVPVALFKGMQVAAGLALPKDITLRIDKEG
jgi:hypothetical protein